MLQARCFIDLHEIDTISGMKSERLPFEGLINCRDLGGFIGESGRKTVYGKVFRSNSLDEITSHDKEVLENDLHIRYVVDLRRPKENALYPDQFLENVTYLCLPFQEDDSSRPSFPHKKYEFKNKGLEGNANFLFQRDKDGSSMKVMRKYYQDSLSDKEAQRSIFAFFRLLLDLKDGAVLFHCHDGKDRTGILSMLYLGILGVSDKDIVEDYLATNDYVREKREKRKKYFDEVIHLPKDDPMYNSLLILAGVDRSWIEMAMSELYRFGGYERYLIEQVGLTKEMILALRNKYLH